MGYILTAIGAAFYGVLGSLLGMGVTGESVGFAKTFFLVIALILTGIGVIKTLVRGEGLKGKLIGLAIHAAIWVGLCWALSILVPVVIIIVIVFLIDRFVFGGTLLLTIMNLFSKEDVFPPVVAYDNAGKKWVISNNLIDTFEYTCEETGAVAVVNENAANKAEKVMTAIDGTVLSW